VLLPPGRPGSHMILESNSSREDKK
jgi:hypothetical protein